MKSLPRIRVGENGRCRACGAPAWRRLGQTLIAALGAGGLLLSSGCYQKAAEGDPTTPNAAAAVQIVTPELRPMSHVVCQPGFVEAYQQTAIYAKLSGFIEAYYVDIGQKVKKGELLCKISVPELEEEHQQKLAQVVLDTNGVEQANRLVEVAQRNLQTAAAEVTEAEASVGRYKAEVARWTSEMKRLTQMVQDKVMDKQILDETQRQLDSDKSAVDAANAAVTARKAAQKTREADLSKAKVDVEVAKSRVKVSEAEERRTAAMLTYTKIIAPYDGVVTVRNAEPGEYVYAASGAKDGSQGVPIFVVAQTDRVRVFVDVPEAYARFVRKGTKAEVRVEALSGFAIPAEVTRTSWSLDEKTRTLRAEIDLPIQADDGLRPGTYVYGRVFIQQPQTRVLPEQALVVLGNQTYCYVVVDGKAVRTSVQRGMDDGNWVEVVRKKLGDAWKQFTGDEQVIVGDLSEISDGQAVQVAQEKAAHAAARERVLAESR